jgi:hypothetical protein
LYPWHPWCALYVAIHEAIGKSNELVFRCTLSGSDASRSVEIPAWMFDRAACEEARLTAAPYVISAAALSAFTSARCIVLELRLSLLLDRPRRRGSRRLRRAVTLYERVSQKQKVIGQIWPLPTVVLARPDPFVAITTPALLAQLAALIGASRKCKLL